ncbi:Muscarinic acetylcholine receptor DM1 [Holothuria leucospilota]|uniref:Muscarinic acetylcholine receptor DM1 n=1 Tax=Holothuria leucospilota TaxID=206669 RepID=A0A9Q1HB15_HOLLE|nr:Muscarinic acetylcholine receptor DM1 [Holothuria leucospilota]
MAYTSASGLYVKMTSSMMESSSALPTSNTSNIVMLYCHGILGVFTIIANAFVIATYARSKTVRAVVVNVYIFYLAIADFLVGLFILLATFIWGMLSYPEFPTLVCHSWTVIKHFAILMSALVIILLSFDRYLLVVNPLRYQTSLTIGKIHKIVIAVGVVCFTYCIFMYALSFLFVVPPSPSDEINFHVCIPYQETKVSYLVLVSFIDFVLPFSVLVMVNVAFFWKLVHKMKDISNLNTVPAQSLQKMGSTEVNVDPTFPEKIDNLTKIEKEIKPSHPTKALLVQEKAKLRRIAKKLTTYVLVFLICWLPFEVASCLPACGVTVLPSVINVTGLLISSNSLINPLLYAVFQQRYRKICFQCTYFSMCHGSKTSS